ncbi:MAG: hypothetical protein MUC88_16700 [Planctomycetes bacterium]|jgi:hypothetical protein|nr:hypothetical protein [Planctomycetota bacterium]
MAKSKRIAFTLDEQWLQALTGLAGTFGVSAQEVIRRSLPDEAVTSLFFQCQIFRPGLQWDEVADVGRIAIREHLRATYMRGLQEHLMRLDVSLESSADEVEAAKQRALEEMRSDLARPLEPQLAKAAEDSVYLGYLYEAWKQARAGRPGYAIEPIGIAGAKNAPAGAARAWAVLKDGQVV